MVPNRLHVLCWSDWQTKAANQRCRCVQLVFSLFRLVLQRGSLQRLLRLMTMIKGNRKGSSDLKQDLVIKRNYCRENWSYFDSGCIWESYIAGVEFDDLLSQLKITECVLFYWLQKRKRRYWLWTSCKHWYAMVYYTDSFESMFCV